MKDSNESGSRPMSEQVSEAIQAGINPMSCFRAAVTSGQESRLETETRSFSIREAFKQLHAVTRFAWGDRMGLVTLTKRQLLQSPVPQVATAQIFAETQPVFFKAPVDETCPHT